MRHFLLFISCASVLWQIVTSFDYMVEFIKILNDNQPLHKIGRRDVENITEFSAYEIFEIIDATSDEFDIVDRKDAVFILGNKGSNARKLSLFLSGVELKAMTHDDVSNEFRIDDDNEPIRKLHNVIPMPMIDEETDILFYDCFEFDESTSIAYEIAASFYMFQLLTYVDSSKFVFVTSHISVKIDSNQQDFLAFAKYATELLKNIEKYQDGIALVVTKVETTNKDPSEIDDAQVILQIAEFLDQTIQNLNQSQNNTEVSKFIESLLKKDPNTNEFNRIKIHRLAPETGLQDGMESQQSNKNAIIDMVKNTLKYITKDGGDFGYSILDRLRNQSDEIIDELEFRLDLNVCKIGMEFVKFYAQQEEQISDLDVLHDTIKMAHEKLSKVDANELHELRVQLIDTIDDLKLKSSGGNLKKLQTDIQFAEFLKSMDIGNLPNSSEAWKGLANTKMSLFESSVWYGFLIYLHEKLSGINVQENIEMYNTPLLRYRIIRAIVQMGQNGSKFFNEVEIPEFVNAIDSSIYLQIENFRINSRKLKLLLTVLHQATDCNLVTSCSMDKLSLRGYNVKLSDVTGCKAKFIEIFALNNFYVDVDFQKPEILQQISIIAPKWVTIGNIFFSLNDMYGNSASDFLGIADSFEYVRNGMPQDDGNGNYDVFF